MFLFQMLVKGKELMTNASTIANSVIVVNLAAKIPAGKIILFHYQFLRRTAIFQNISTALYHAKSHRVHAR